MHRYTYKLTYLLINIFSVERGRNKNNVGHSCGLLDEDQPVVVADNNNVGVSVTSGQHQQHFHSSGKVTASRR